jgi:mRNA interferase YafQ
MNLKRTAASKRTKLPLRPDYAKQFEKDWESLSESGRYDMHNLKEAMLLLIANDRPLPAEWKDHTLNGEWEGCRECHIGGDFLLIYKTDDENNPARIVFVRTGTHSQLFKL